MTKADPRVPPETRDPYIMKERMDAMGDIVKKYDPGDTVNNFKESVPNLDVDVYNSATPEEKYFCQLYNEHGNASGAAILAFAHKKYTKSYYTVLGCRLKKKFKLTAKNRITINKKGELKKTNTPIRTTSDMVSLIKEKYANGELDEENLYRQMRDLAYRSDFDQVRFNALKELKIWVKEAKNEIEAAELSKRNVVDLMASALSDLPKDKYMKVLVGVRVRRRVFRREMVKTFDAETIRNEERRKVIRLERMPGEMGLIGQTT